MNPSQTEPDRILRWPEVQRITGYSRTTIWRLEQEDKFPPRRQLGSNMIGWLHSEVADWLASLPKVESGDRGAA